MLIVLALAAAFAAGDPTPPAATPSAATPSATTPSAAGDAQAVATGKGGAPVGKPAGKSDRICINDPQLGSKIPTRRCMDRAEYERQQVEQRRYMESLQRDTRAPSGSVTQ